MGRGKMKETKLLREIKEITDNPDLHFWIKCKKLVKIKTSDRPGSYEGSKLIRSFFKKPAGRFQDKFDTAYVRPYLDAWVGRQAFDHVNSKYLNEDLSCKIGRAPRGISVIEKPESPYRFKNYLERKYPEAFERFEEIKKAQDSRRGYTERTDDYAWQHIFDVTIRQLATTYRYNSEKPLWQKIPKDEQNERRQLDLAMEKAQTDYKNLKKASKLPPRYLYNEVSLAELQQERRNHTYAKFKDHFIMTETVLHYDNSEVSFGVGKLEHTDRAILFRNKKGVVLSKSLKTYSGHFVLDTIEEYFGKVKEFFVPAELKPVQLNRKMTVLEMTKHGRFRTFERLFGNQHYDYCVLRDDITCHSSSIELCEMGWKKKKAAKDQAKKADGKVINMVFCQRLHFCRTGIEDFCIDNNLDPAAEYTLGEIRVAVSKKLGHNQQRYGYELRQIGVL